MKRLNETAPKIFSTIYPSFGYTIYNNWLTPIFRKENGIFVSSDYRWVGSFSNGLAPVFTSGMRFGYIDLYGELVISAVYSEASPFSCDRAFVRMVPEPGCDGASTLSDSVTCLIDKSGNIVTAFEGEMYYSEFVSGFCTVELFEGLGEEDSRGLLGLIDTEGNWVCEPCSDYLNESDRDSCDTEGFLHANFGVPIIREVQQREREKDTFRYTDIRWEENGFIYYTLGEKLALKNEAGDYMMWIGRY